MTLPILYEDEQLLVVDKPALIPVLREGPGTEETVADLLQASVPACAALGSELRYGIVHRLDKNTSGALLVAKTPEVFTWLQRQFQERLVQKTYLVLAVGVFREQKGIIETPLGRSPLDKRKQKAYEEGKTNAREAVTVWRVLHQYPKAALLEVSPKTGRKHQIRAHLASLHHPVAGDPLYGFKNQYLPPGLSRQFLHAHSLRFLLPHGKHKEVHAPLPPDLAQVLETLEKGNEV